MTGFATLDFIDGLAIAANIFFLLCASGISLIVGAIWSRRSSTSHLPLRILCFAFYSSFLIFIASLIICIIFILSGVLRGPFDFVCMAFWPFTSGVIAFFACHQDKRIRSNRRCRNV
jgi:hypothetical protein